MLLLDSTLVTRQMLLPLALRSRHKQYRWRGRDYRWGVRLGLQYILELKEARRGQTNWKHVKLTSFS